MAHLDWLLLRTRQSVLNFLIATATLHLLAGCLQILFLGVMVARLGYNSDAFAARDTQALQNPNFSLFAQLLAPALFSILLSLCYRPLRLRKYGTVFAIGGVAFANAALALWAHPPVPEWHAMQLLLALQSGILFLKLSTLPTPRKESPL